MCTVGNFHGNHSLPLFTGALWALPSLSFFIFLFDLLVSFFLFFRLTRFFFAVVAAWAFLCAACARRPFLRTLALSRAAFSLPFVGAGQPSSVHSTKNERSNENSGFAALLPCVPASTTNCGASLCKNTLIQLAKFRKESAGDRARAMYEVSRGNSTSVGTTDFILPPAGSYCNHRICWDGV